MELSSDRGVATLEMSQAKSKNDDTFDVDGDYESLPPDVSVATHMTAGAVAGILEHTVMYPVDSVKVTHPEGSQWLFIGVFLERLIQQYVLSGPFRSETAQ